jgi:hypothetical protein
VPPAYRNNCPNFCDCVVRDAAGLWLSNPRVHQDYMAGAETDDVRRLQLIALGCLRHIVRQ